MTDIGFDGVAAFALGFLMIGFGALGLVTEGVVAWRGRRAGRRSRALPFMLPAGYAALGTGLLIAAEAGSLDTRAAADRLSPICALAGLVLWLAIRIALSRPAAATGERARAPATRTPP